MKYTKSPKVKAKSKEQDLNVEVIDNPDGSATLHLDIGPKMRKIILSSAGKKRLTQKIVEKFVIDTINHMIIQDNCVIKS